MLNILFVAPAMAKMVRKLRELIVEAFPLLQRSVLQLQLFLPKLWLQPITADVVEQTKWVTLATKN